MIVVCEIRECGEERRGEERGGEERGGEERRKKRWSLMFISEHLDQCL